MYVCNVTLQSEIENLCEHLKLSTIKALSMYPVHCAEDDNGWQTVKNKRRFGEKRKVKKQRLSAAVPAQRARMESVDGGSKYTTECVPKELGTYSMSDGEKTRANKINARNYSAVRSMCDSEVVLRKERVKMTRRCGYRA